MSIVRFVIAVIISGWLSTILPNKLCLIMLQSCTYTKTLSNGHDFKIVEHRPETKYIQLSVVEVKAAGKQN